MLINFTGLRIKLWVRSCRIFSPFPLFPLAAPDKRTLDVLKHLYYSSWTVGKWGTNSCYQKSLRPANQPARLDPGTNCPPDSHQQGHLLINISITNMQLWVAKHALEYN